MIEPGSSADVRFAARLVVEGVVPQDKMRAVLAKKKELAERGPGDAELELDMSVIGFEGIFQDIVQRSALDFVEVEVAWTCSKMRPDGFGGAATLIMADDIESVSTAGWLEEAVARFHGDAPG